MGETFRDCRAIDDKFLTELHTGKLKSFVDFIKTHDDLELCFRGNRAEGAQAITIYKNNHIVWDIETKDFANYKIHISFNHARYSENWKEIKKRLVDLKFADKKLTKDGIKKLSYKVNKSVSKEFVEASYKLVMEFMGNFFDFSTRTNNNRQADDYFKREINPIDLKSRKSFLVEKIKQQDLFSRALNGKGMYYAYDLEFSQKHNSNSTGNQPDMLAIKSENGKNKLCLIEVKSKKNACDQDGSGVVDHLVGMVKYIDAIIEGQAVIDNRKIEAHKIIESYKRLGIHSSKIDLSKNPINGIEIMFIFTDTHIDSEYKYDISKNSKDVPATKWIADAKNQARLKQEIAKYPKVEFSFKTYIDGQLNDVII